MTDEEFSKQAFPLKECKNCGTTHLWKFWTICPECGALFPHEKDEPLTEEDKNKLVIMTEESGEV